MFIQHLMPDGRQVPQWFMPPSDIIPDDVWEATVEKSEQLRAKGYSFHVELLSDYQTVSLTIESPDDDVGDVAIKLVKNGPDVPQATIDLIMGFNP